MLEDKHFYYSEGDQQIGPLTLTQLEEAKLSDSTLVWFDGLEEWKPLSELTELRNTLNVNTPPPLPNRIVPPSKTEVSGEITIKKEKKLNPILEKVKPSQSNLRLFLIWTGLHLFAMLMSYSQIEVFNAEGDPEAAEFWPFVEFVYSYKTKTAEGLEELSKHGSVSLAVLYQDNSGFRGLFYQYDWTEFAAYVGGEFIVFLIVRLSSEEEKEVVQQQV